MLASIVSNWLVWLLLAATLWGHASLCLAGSALAASRDKVMIDPQDFDLPLEEMSLQAKGQPSAPRPSWRELTVYLREVPPAFHTIPDYRTALCFFTLGYPKVQQILNDWSKN